MTTPQPNPTDDLEAAKAVADMEIAERQFYKVISLSGVALARYTQLREAMLRVVSVWSKQPVAALRPAGVGEAVAWRYRWLPANRSEPGEWREPTNVRWDSHDDFEEQPLYATPAHPDAALMERVRTVLEDLNFSAIPIEMSKPLQWAVSDAALSALGELLSDLKAEAGR